jgi:nucleoside-diphosphate-sugar epimerase
LNILVVGGAGYVGGWLVDELAIQHGYNVRVIDKLLYDETYLKNVDFKNIDINNYGLMNAHLEWADTVIWLAAIVGDGACSLNPDLTIKTNVKSIQNLVDNFGGQIIFMSTCSVYGAQDGELSEISELNPLSLYAETKIMAEEILLNSKQDTIIFRLGTLFGVSDQIARLRVDLVVNVLTIRAFYDKVMTVYGGEQYRPLLHVRDVSTAIKNVIGLRGKRLYNIHTINSTIKGVAEVIQNEIIGSSIQTTDMSFQDSRNYKVSSLLASEEIDFKPKYDLIFGINQIISILNDGRIKDVNNKRFSNSLALENSK